MARYCIPDTHGCLNTVLTLINKLDKGDDTFYFLGDYIDRGPKSKELLDYLMEKTLSEPNRFYCIRGNHDEWLSILWDKTKNPGPYGMGDSYRSWLVNGGSRTMDSFGAKHILEIPEKYIVWINKLPVYIELEDFILVHGGMNFYLDNPLLTAESDMMWERPYGEQTFADNWKLGKKKVIVGHTIRHIELIKSYIEDNCNVIMIDNGCFMGNSKAGTGSLISLNLDTMEINLQENIDYGSKP